MGRIPYGAVIRIFEIKRIDNYLFPGALSRAFLAKGDFGGEGAPESVGPEREGHLWT